MEDGACVEVDRVRVRARVRVWVRVWVRVRARVRVRVRARVNVRVRVRVPASRSTTTEYSRSATGGAEACLGLRLGLG